MDTISTVIFDEELLTVSAERFTDDVDNDGPLWFSLAIDGEETTLSEREALILVAAIASAASGNTMRRPITEALHDWPVPYIVDPHDTDDV